jgi:hypothetical protein
LQTAQCSVDSARVRHNAESLLVGKDVLQFAEEVMEARPLVQDGQYNDCMQTGQGVEWARAVSEEGDSRSSTEAGL